MSRPQAQFNFAISPTVKTLIIVNVVIWFVVQVLGEKFGGLPISRYFSLIPASVIYEFQIWQLVTYMFLHTFSVTHILFNMLMLWFMGTELEQRWGKKFFLTYYLATGAGAALIYVAGTFIYYLIRPDVTALVVPVMGASGAVFGLMLAYGILFGERTIYLFGAFPIKAKFFVLVMGAIEVSSLLTADVNGGDVAYLCHIGGLLSGYLILVGWTRFQRLQWNMKGKKKGRNLRLVVDNEKSEKTPKYWN